MIAVLATRLSAIGLNIERIATQNKDVEFTFVDLELQVSSRTHLAHVMKRLRSVEGVLKVVRSARALTDALDHSRTITRRRFVAWPCSPLSPLFNKGPLHITKEIVVSNRAVIATQAAPQAIGPYSQGIKVGNTVWISGQIPLDPEFYGNGEGDITAEAEQVFNNLSAVAEAAGGTLDDAVKINISLTDLGDFDAVNAVMARHFRMSPIPQEPAFRSPHCPKARASKSRLFSSL